MTARAVLDGIKTQLATITPGPWEVERYRHGGGRIWHHPRPGIRFLIADTYEGERNREFIAAAPTHVARLTAAVEAVLGVHAPDTFGECRQCSDGPGFYHAYPCPTVAAIEAALTEDGR